MNSPRHNPIIIDVETSYLAKTGNGFSWGHPLVWLGITIGLLFLGYIWLSVYAGNTNSPSPANTVKMLPPEEATFHVVADPVRKEAKMTITRQNDEQRAEQYLEIESVEDQILPLLDSADVQFENEQYVSPPGDNAWESYLAILAIDPDESIATAGLTKVKSKLIGSSEQAIDRGEYSEAENWLVQLDQIQPEDPLQDDLREEIKTLISADADRKLREQKEEEKQEKIATSLEQVEKELGNSKPNHNKVRDLFARIVELDPENEVAKKGLIDLSDRILDEVEQALRNENLDAASRGLKTAADVSPDNKRISALQLALDGSVKRKREEEEEREKEKIAQQRAAEEAASAKKSAAAALAAAESSANNSRKVIKATTTKNTAATQISSVDISTTVTNALTDQQVEATSGTIGEQPKIVTGIIGLDNKAKPSTTPKKRDNGPSLSDGIRAYYDGNYAKSFELLYPLAQEGIPRAQFRIGIMYQFGRSVAKNTDLAEKWFTAALPQLLRQSQQGAAWAQTDLGTAYEFGISLAQDYERAAHWYQKAADQGYAGAQTNLGVLYAQGDGVPYNRSKAIDWLRKAAAQGDRVAAENLGILGVK